MNKALYRTMRPLRFTEVRDQELPVQVLKNQLKTNTVSHGYLFCGSRGTGKTSCAKILARAVNCLHPQDGEPCNDCANCKEILEERAVDVLEIDAASNNGVDNIRELKNMGVYPPSFLKKKVYIIDEAHMLSTAAFNALLKILEEPPEHLIFILATTDPEKLPDTVKSRLQRFDFHAISKGAIEATLRDVTKKLGEEVEAPVYGLIANQARGALRDALSFLDQLLALPTRPITMGEATELLGVTPMEELMPLLHGLLTDNGAEVFQVSSRLVEEGKQPDRLVLSLMEMLRDLFGLHHGLEWESPYDEELKSLLESSKPKQILHLLDHLRELLQDLQYAFDPGLIFQIGLATAGLSSTDVPKEGKPWTPTSPRKQSLPPKKETPKPPKVEDRNLEETPTVDKKERVEPAQGEGQLGVEPNTNETPPEEPEAPVDGCETMLNFPEEIHGGTPMDHGPLDPEDLMEEDLPPVEEESLPHAMVDSEEDQTDAVEGSTWDPNHCEELDEEECENEDGRRFLEEMMRENPLLQSLGDDYWVKLEDNVLTFTKRFPEIAETILENYKEDIREQLKDLLKRRDVYVVTRNMNPIIDELTLDFGNRLIIKDE